MQESRDKRGTWAKWSIDGLYLGTLHEHYRCHIIQVKKSKTISDKVFFKHKYITQPTLTPTDTLVKAIDDLTCALKGSRNLQGIQQIERLKKDQPTFEQNTNRPGQHVRPTFGNPRKHANTKGGRHQTTSSINSQPISPSEWRNNWINIRASSKGAKRKG